MTRPAKVRETQARPVSTWEVLPALSPRPPRKAGRARPQIETIRDAMLSAAERSSWLTLEEIGNLTESGEASISAQLRNLRKCGYVLKKRRRMGAYRTVGASLIAPWEYLLAPEAGEYARRLV